MVTLNRIYTRTGDAGKTRLATGQPVSKADLRVEAYGGIDETNACIGLARVHLTADPELDAMLGRIQNELFDLGADLAMPAKEGEAEGSKLRILDSQVARLEEAGEPVSGPAMRYLNRLSDHLFVAARWANEGGKAEVFWQSGATR